MGTQAFSRAGWSCFRRLHHPRKCVGVLRGHPTDAYDLRRVQAEQDLCKRECESDLKNRLSFFMDHKWFLANKTNWHQRAHTDGDALPTSKEFIPHRTKVGVHTALGVARKDAVSGLEVLIQSRNRTIEISSKSQGKVVEVHSSITDVNELSKEMFLAMSAPLKDSPLDAIPSETESLCEFCNSINFGLTGFQESGFDKGRLFDKTRPLREVLQNLKCTFCERVAESCRKWSRGKFDIEALDLQNDCNRAHYEMVSLDSVEVVGAKDKPKGHLIRVQVALKVLSPKRERYGLLLDFQRCSQDSPRVEDFCNGRRPSNWGIRREHAYSGRIRPLTTDTRLFRRWIDTCCATHPAPYCGKCICRDEVEERLTFMGLDGLRLVDVKKMCVVDVRGNMNYTALSYVWGEYKLKQYQKELPKLTSENRFRFRESGSLRRVMLPKTILDAIELTDSLGYQYIWIDCLCIVQGDETDERYFIPQMDVIFGCAVFTIVAASGDNADAGLPGFRPNSRICEQEPFAIKGVSLVRTLDPERSEEKHSSFYGYLKDSVWCKRAWTFQEKLLSPRSLIFTEEQVYWECQTATWCEDGLWETMESPTLYRHCFGDKDYRHPWEDSVERRYRKMVEEYSGRTLKYEKDRRDAFEGILERFQWDAKRTQLFLWALPKRFLSNALTWRCETRCPDRRQHKCRVTSEWGQPIKDCPCPSWSWLGWVGKVCFNTSHGRLDAETVDLIFYYFFGSKLLSANQTGATQSLSDMGVRDHDDRTMVTREDIPKSVDPYLVLEADQSNILFFWTSTARLHVQHDGVDSDGNDKLILSRNGNDVPAKFWFHTPSFPPGHGELVDLVVIGKFAEFRVGEGAVTREESEKDRNLLAVLLVSWKNGIAYREGLVHIQLSDWVALDNREWKLVFLG